MQNIQVCPYSREMGKLLLEEFSDLPEATQAIIVA